jgi:hypothetical protein
VRTMLKHFKDSMLQLFPTTKFRIILIVLVMTAAFISVSELAVAKLFTQIILHESELSTTEIILYVLGFFIFFGGTRAGHYFQKSL